MTYHIPMDEETTVTRFTTDRDAKNDILNALAGTDGVWDDDAIDSIFREAYEWKIDVNDEGQELLNTGGFEQVVSAEGFWEIVARHEKD
jgi:hypothetical protein